MSATKGGVRRLSLKKKKGVTARTPFQRDDKIDYDDDVEKVFTRIVAFANENVVLAYTALSMWGKERAKVLDIVKKFGPDKTARRLLQTARFAFFYNT